MAISAACDEELDAWIRSKTGLRLRRFLADLKAFEDIGEERKTEAGRNSQSMRKKGTEEKARDRGGEETTEGNKGK